MKLSRGFSSALLHWYDKYGRADLPWQKERTPYRVWVSEIMLQQTRVGTVIPFYERFMAAMPNIEALAEAPEDKILHLWTGLGYYTRARNLHRSAQIICNEYAGQFPKDLDRLQALPGIGRSTAGAILSLSMDGRAPILDGNVKRVLARYHNIEGWPGQKLISEHLWKLAEIHTPKVRVADYTQAIMDLGATCCKRIKPSCSICPVQKECQARIETRQDELPSRKPRKKNPLRTRWLAVITREPDEVLLQKRPKRGIWGGLWVPPEFTTRQSIIEWMSDYCGQLEGQFRIETPLRHNFTHFTLKATPVRAHLEWNQTTGQNVKVDADNLQWFSCHPLPPVGLPAPIARLLQSLSQKVSLEE